VGVALRGGGSRRGLKGERSGMRRRCEGGPQGQQRRGEGAANGPFSHRGRSGAVATKLRRLKGIGGSNMMQESALTKSCGVVGRKTALFDDSEDPIYFPEQSFLIFVPSPCTPLWASCLHGTITNNCAPMSHVVMGDSCSLLSLRAARRALRFLQAR
jgi:hypothetical protein